ncbi:FecR domain-containing protein [Sphingobium sp. JS3065]|uniref:FecR family protein n=1 Tax=Sphingobium sp. JS3065 TaxID=2970925 RepID=UPI0022651AED|nr:FecR domain-containing protein [Sphingobium sp. JS3065]UZW57346.1 FecR domain-containing protein [Sphingobium sp. JS3065]
MNMPADREGDIAMEAASWHARLDAPYMDWDGFAAWLDADAAHRTAYDSVALIDADIDALRPAILAALPANDRGEVASSTGSCRYWWMGGGVAAMVALAAVVAMRLTAPNVEDIVAYATGPDTTRMIVLKDGSHILLDRNSRLALADGPSPRVDMRSGAAFFDVRHDPSRRFTIAAGAYEVRDIGTRFDLVVTPQQLSIAVSDGSVVVAPKAAKGVTIAAGKRMDVITGSGEAKVGAVDIAAIGAWRRGQLIYNAAPLTLVAADLSRYVGRQVMVDPTIGDLRLSGVLTISDGAGLVEQIEALLPVEAVERDGTMRLVGRSAR